MDKPKQITIDDFLPCPFCGSKRLYLEMSAHERTYDEFGRGSQVNVDREAEEAKILCPCGARMSKIWTEEHFELIEGDTYRKIPTEYAEEVLLKAWNRRA